MNRIHEIMSRDVVTVAPSDTIGRAAQLMERYDVGSLPVCDGRRLIGMLTDRDITVRALAVGMMPDTPVREVASHGAEWCFDDDDVDAIQRQMSVAQLHRMPVIDRQRRLVGMLSLGDIATRGDSVSRDELANTLEGVSQPVAGSASRHASKGGSQAGSAAQASAKSASQASSKSTAQAASQRTVQSSNTPPEADARAEQPASASTAQRPSSKPRLH
jgi:CBS domain-containing protein